MGAAGDYKRPGYHLDQYRLFTRSDFGAIGGVSIKIKNLSIGYSHYALTRAEIESRPTKQQVETAVQASERGELDEKTLPYRDFTKVSYGGGKGHNIGAFYNLWEGTPTGIGLSVLNAGNTKFTESTTFKGKEFSEIDKTIKEDASTYQVELNVPQAIPQVVNSGVSIGWQDQNRIFEAVVSADAHDIQHKIKKESLSASWQVGVSLPDSAAMAMTWPLISLEPVKDLAGKKTKTKGAEQIIHMGLSSLKYFGGYRGNSYFTRGAAIGFHFGLNHKVSVLKAEIEGYELTPLMDSNLVPEVGARGTLSLILMF